MKIKFLFLMFSLFSSSFFFSGFSSGNASVVVKKQIYEWRIYTLTDPNGSLDSFFEEILIPAYNCRNISVGAFTKYKNDGKEQRFLLFVYPDMQTYTKTRKDLMNDSLFNKAARPFFDESAAQPVYTEYETFLCEAFDKIPILRKPDPARTLFELRIYHGPNEDANQRKIKMFNTEEIDLFDRVGINSVCYGDIFAGKHMPALIYLTWHADEDARNVAWNKFMSHPEWLKMKNKAEYKNTATNNQVILLSPMNYSQF